MAEANEPQVSAEQQQALDTIMQLAQQGAAAQQLPEADPIGGFFAGPAGPINPQGEFVGPYRQQSPESIGGAYHEGDDLEILASMNTERLARLQDALVANGLVREVVPGRIDENTRKGLSTLMALGNRQSVTWQSVLEGITRSGGLAGAEEAADKFDPAPYIKPDYASISQSVKQTFRDELGRDPDESEMEEMASFLGGMTRQQYERDVELSRMEWERENGMTPEDAGPVEGTAIDPMARFQEQFEKVYRHERQFVEDKEAAVGSREQVGASTGLLSAMSQQGGRSG